MAWGVGVFGTERRSERIDSSQSHSPELAFELTGDGKSRRLSEEVRRVVYLPAFVLLQIIQVLSRYLKHLPRSLAVARRDYRRMKINEPASVKKRVYRHCHLMTHTEYSPERIGTRSQMSYVA